MKSLMIILSFYITSFSYGQINTESMRDNNRILGLHHKLNMSFSYISGNSEFIMFHGNYRLDYHSKQKWHGFVIINHDRAHEKSEKEFNNRGFAHLRALHHWKPKIHLESFLQKEFNHFLNLENRELLGFGMRMHPMNELYVGIGLMNEVELYQFSPKEHVNLKSTNYINHSFKMNEMIDIQNVLYYQFISANIEHYRILWDGNLNIKASNSISFHMNLNYRYDISDINPTGDSYFEITNGLGFSF